MARYIDVDALKDNFCNACSTCKRYTRTFEECRNKTDSYGNVCFKMRLIDTTPTADVAPRSEISEAVEKIVSATDKVIRETKAEVAREIFEEIEALFDRYPTLRSIGGKALAELKKKYTEPGAE